MIISLRAPPCRDQSRDHAAANRPSESFINGLVFTLKGPALARRKPSVEGHRTNESIDLVWSLLDELWHDRHLNITEQSDGILLAYVAAAEPCPYP